MTGEPAYRDFKEVVTGVTPTGVPDEKMGTGKPAGTSDLEGLRLFVLLGRTIALAGEGVWP